MQSLLNTAGNVFCPVSSVYYGRNGQIELVFDYERIGHRLGLEALLNTIGAIDVVYVITPDTLTQIYGHEYGDKYDTQLADMQAFETAQAKFVDFLLS